MKNYLEILEKFKDVKEIDDLINGVNKLRYYYTTRQYQNMQEHINALTTKYFIETIAWNTVNPVMPITYEQSYLNAEHFLQTQCIKILIEKVTDFKQRLTKEEVAIIDSVIKPLE